MSSKLQELAEAFGKASSGAEAVQVVDHTTYQAGYEEARQVSVMRGSTTLGWLEQAGNGRWSLRAPDEAKFNDVAPLMKALDDANIKISTDDNG